jgi:hypothetical protein
LGIIEIFSFSLHFLKQENLIFYKKHFSIIVVVFVFATFFNLRMSVDYPIVIYAPVLCMIFLPIVSKILILTMKTGLKKILHRDLHKKFDTYFNTNKISLISTNLKNLHLQETNILNKMTN